MKRAYTIGLLGNPNCGKTTLFNALTGAKQRVGNWPGVTVERKSGEYHFADQHFEVVDLPGTYSLDIIDYALSLDERVARDFVQQGAADLIVNIVDASNLERNLYLSAQLIEMGVPLLIVLNMIDVAKSKGMKVDAARLAEELGCPVVPLIASAKQGMAELKAAIAQASAKPPRPTVSFAYGEALEQAIARLVEALAQARPDLAAPRALAVRLLEGDLLARQRAGEALSVLAQQLAGALGEDLDIMVADGRYSLANRIAAAVVQSEGYIGHRLTERLDRVVLSRWLGIPIFLSMMYLMFMFTINLGGAFVDFFEQIAGALFVEGFAELLGAFGAPAWLSLLLAQGIGGGLQTVATFIPVIGFLFLFLSFLEDSGYMARAAFIMDRLMRTIGLPGKSFVPLIVGFGCNVPAILATRMLEQRRDRLLTIAMAPFMSCSARLPVYVLFGAAFFAENAQNVVFALYLTGISVALTTGWLLKNTLLYGEATPLIMELPPYLLPSPQSVLLHTWDRLKNFIVKAGRVIVPMVLVLNLLNTLDSEGRFGAQGSDQSLLATLGRAIAPAFSPFGVQPENWPAAVGIFTGVLAKEAVVGTLNTAYRSLAENEADKVSDVSEETRPFDLAERLAAAWATIPEKLDEAWAKWRDPIGLAVDDLADRASAAEAQQASAATFGAMAARFDGPAGALAYLLFILLYMPCSAAIAAVYQESGVRWALFVAAWTSGLAYGLATAWYQLATFTQHPATSLLALGLVGAASVAAVLAMRHHGRQQNASTLARPSQA